MNENHQGGMKEPGETNPDSLMEPSQNHTTPDTEPIKENPDKPDPLKKDIVIGIKFVNNGKVFPFLINDRDFRVGDWVIVEAEKGESFGMIAMSRLYYDEKKKQSRNMKRVLRKVTPEDEKRISKNSDLEREGTEICQKKIKERKLPMNLSRVKFSFDGQKATFYFTAEGRVDFRELVKDLAQHFRSKIEMKQVGVRDEARIMGGCGPCGIKLCCASFLKDFEPVSIKMAKHQDLSLNPVKISGVCGRLMCCLVYEHDTYKDLKKKFPKCGSCVKTECGTGTIKEIHLLQDKVTVFYPEESKKETHSLSEITVLQNNPPKKTPEKQKTTPRKPEKPARKKEHRNQRP